MEARGNQRGKEHMCNLAGKRQVLVLSAPVDIGHTNRPTHPRHCLDLLKPWHICFDRLFCVFKPHIYSEASLTPDN